MANLNRLCQSIPSHCPGSRPHTDRR